MKKLFAGIVAALALIPVVANAASYEKGEYVNFAGNDSDWSAFHAAGTPEEIAEYLEKTGVGTLYIEDAAHDGYLRVISLVANVTRSDGLYAHGGTIETGALYEKVALENRKEVVKPYGYATNEDNGVDVTVATLADITAIFGVSAENDKVQLTDKNKAIFEIMTAKTEDGKVYIFTSTDKTGADDTYYALEVTKADGAVTNVELVAHTAEGTFNAALFSVLEMNKAYVCTDAPEESYACYECTTTDNQTEFQWRVEGTQADTCKKSTKITSKAKCVKSPKTGVDSYLIPSAIVLGVCAIVLTVVKRKDAFRSI